MKHQVKPVPANEGRQAPSLPSNEGSFPEKHRKCSTDQSPSRGRERIGRSGNAPEARTALPDSDGPSSRLDKGTICDLRDIKPQYEAFRLLLRDYGQGLVEATITVNTSSRPNTDLVGDPPKKTPEQVQENKARAYRRAKTAVRQSIMAAKLDHLLTLTYRENQTDHALAWKHFGRFMRLVRKHHPKGYPFVAVLERQKRGAMHVHAAVHGRQNVKLLRRLWHQAIGTTDGNIDVKYFRGKLSTLSRYLSKYITKDLDTEHTEGQHRYKRSRGIEVPALIVMLPFNVAVEAEITQLFQSCSATVEYLDNHLDDEGPKWLWACSW
ncbi:MAG: hypothetical protein RIC29_15840 [Rhodospirillaceae bacterium]